MKEQIRLLRKELAEHAEVENELAKRSHFCQRVIKKYRTQLEILESQKNNLTSTDGVITGPKPSVG